MSRNAFTTSVRVEKNRLPSMTPKLRAVLDAEVGRCALAIEAGAKQRNAAYGLVDTSAMINGWEARKLKERKWVVATPVEYAVYWEFGHRNIFTRRYEAPKPMLRPAAADAFPRFVQRLQAAVPGGLR